MDVFLEVFFSVVFERFFVIFWSPFGLLGTPWGCQMEEKKGAKLMFFRDPPFGCHFGVILGGFLVDLGRFLVPFGEASERYFGNVFLWPFAPLPLAFYKILGRNFGSCVALAPLCSSALLVCPGVFCGPLFPFPPCTSAARGAIEWCSLVFPVFVRVLVLPLPV